LQITPNKVSFQQIKAMANPFDPQWDAYFQNRGLKRSRAITTRSKARIYAVQDGVCTAPDPEGLTKTTHEDLLNTFKPAFLGCLNLVPYYPLAEDVMKKIIHLKMGKIQKRIRESYRAELSYSPELVQHVVDRCQEVETGARNVDHILTRTLLPELAQEFLGRTTPKYAFNTRNTEKVVPNVQTHMSAKTQLN